ncbi:flagellar motor protein MotB [Roseivivax sp. THAF30]|uniref:flagellar motor protein MotB n=1 Tax=Roseivivax sp. THAF30 TaxID=2587852 RepID=UPI00126835DB|nr:flagellar motor protein MotB [Roseivivax sp. THAF30]QFT64991.1 Motility protein B [Roseivivax sp. THAF30]
MPKGASGSNAAPVIIKRKKVVAGGGHHGGAWKVAYADFVTAMMAFFMLMWLLNATTEKQRKGLADYFAPTISISRVSGGGSGTMQGESVFAQDALPQNGTGATSFMPESRISRDDVSQDAGQDAEMDATLADIERVFLERVVESANGNALMAHLATRVTDEGLVLTLSDLPDAPLFTGLAEPTATVETLLTLMGELAGLADNDLAIAAHVRRVPIVVAKDPVWDETEGRVRVAREILISSGLSTRRVQRVVAHADSKADVAAPTHARNNRLEIIFLR